MCLIRILTALKELILHRDCKMTAKTVLDNVGGKKMTVTIGQFFCICLITLDKGKHNL